MFKLAEEGSWEHSAVLGQPRWPRERLPPSPVRRVSGWDPGRMSRTAAAQKLNPRHLHSHLCQIPPPPPCALTLPRVCPPPLSHYWLDAVCKQQQLWPSSCLYNCQQKTRHLWLCLQWWEGHWRCYTAVPLCNAEDWFDTGSWQPYTF